MRDGQLVDVFQLVAEADAAGDRGDFHAGELPQAVHQVEERRLALDRGRNGENHLLHAAAGDALGQQVDLQIRGRNALHRRNDPAQHVVETLVLVGILDREHVGDLLHDADRGPVALVVQTDRAHLLVRKVVALGAVFHVVAETVDALRHFGHRLPLHAQDVDGETQRRAAPHARKLRQLADDVL